MIKPLTKVETLEIMLVETKNALTKEQITEQLLQRKNLTGDVGQQLGLCQQKMRAYKGAIADLESIHKWEVEHPTTESTIGV